MAKDKLESLNLEMVEQKKTSRRVSSILKPGGAATGKDAIIEHLKDSLARQKSYNDKLEKNIDAKQTKLRTLEDQVESCSFAKLLLHDYIALLYKVITAPLS